MPVTADALTAPLPLDLRRPGRADALTGLPVLADFLARLGSQIEVAQARGQSLAVLAIDIDHFTALHHAVGHRQADVLLLAVARSLRRSLPEDAVLGRVAGDTFVALLPGTATFDAALQAAQRLQQDLAGLHPWQGTDVPEWADQRRWRGLSCSIGISLAPMQGQTADQLLRQAEAALDLARANGHGGVQCFSASRVPAAAERRRVMMDLPAALQRGELRLHYQPQFAADSGQLVGAEALVRWQHPQQGLLMPGQFIAAAEACGLIDELGLWVLREACMQARRWQDKGLPAVPVAVNVSPRQLQNPHFLRDVQEALDNAGLAARGLQLEITDSALVVQPEQVIGVLHRCRCLGLQIGLDDFGTGQATLGSLLRLPLDQIKIDRSLVASLPVDHRGAAVVRALVQMAGALGLAVAAEGVETAAQQDFLRAQGCAKLQGHLFAPAWPPGAFETQPWQTLPAPASAALN